MPKRVHPADLTGMTFGRLVVLEDTGRPSSSGRYWRCRCECGAITDVPRGSLLKGNTKGCGCGVRVSGRRKSHGGTATYGYGTREYSIWEQMLFRCCVKSHRCYASYGGRGIDVCDRWMVFDNFHADMGIKPDGLTLERIDNSKGYSPDNCKWASRLEQLRNTRKNLYIEFRGERLCASEWAARLGVERSTISRRLRSGWSVERAIMTAVRPRHKDTTS